MKYVICVTKYGFATIEAGSECDALAIAEKLRDSDFDWGEKGDEEIVEGYR